VDPKLFNIGFIILPINFSQFIVTVFSVIVLGTIFLNYGFQKYNRSQIIKNTPTESVRSMSIGRTKLDGQCRKYEKSVRTPFTKEESIYVSWKIEEKKTSNKDTNKKWETIDSGESKSNFILEDETGTTIIDTENNNVNWKLKSNNTQIWENSIFKRFIYKISSKSYPYDNIKQFCNKRDLDIGHPLFKKRRYKQEYIPLESNVRILGRAEMINNRNEEQSYDQRVKIIKDENIDEFIVSNKDHNNLIRELRINGLKYILIATILYIVSLTLTTLRYMT
jgi:hypothetical protein